MSPRFERRVVLPVEPGEAWAWRARPGALERLQPPWAPARISGGPPGEGGQVTLAPGPLGAPWTLERRDVAPPARWRDVQVAGPFARFAHERLLEPLAGGRTLLTDRVDWALPPALAPLGPLVRRELARRFAWRQRVERDDHALHAAAGAPRMRVLVSGARGLVGGALTALLASGGHEVIRLVRARAAGSGEVAWDPAAGRLDPRALEGLDAVVHLAGESLARRWTGPARARIRDSRLVGTRLLAGALAALERPPRVLVSASAMGWYGDRGDEPLDESAPPGRGFLATLAREWEEATAPAESRGIRVVRLRTALVLSARGGALPPLLRPFALGAGGPLGSGRQWVSWIELDDLAGAILWALARERLRGAVNAAAPAPVTGRELARTVGRVLGRPALVPAPAFALRALLGRDFADEMLLASARLVPRALAEAGYPFRFVALEDALRHTLGRAAAAPGEPPAAPGSGAP